MAKKDIFDESYKTKLPNGQGKNLGKKSKYELKKTASKNPTLRELQYDQNEDGSKDFHYRRDNGKLGGYSEYDGDDDE